MFKSCSRHIGYSLCERSSVVEHHLAKVGVAGSNPVVRLLEAGVADAQDLNPAKGNLRTGSIPVLGSIQFNITMHPWLNWIEYLTTNQAVAGSNPAGCIISGSSSAW